MWSCYTWFPVHVCGVVQRLHDNETNVYAERDRVVNTGGHMW